MSSVTSTFISPEEYLARERLAETRSEYYRGEIFAMAGASEAHATIITNLVGELRSLLRQRPCKVYSTDLRLAVKVTGLYTYPDVMVVCSKPIFADAAVDTVTNPIVVIEVLSESTQDYDRGQKFENYRTIPSLMEYVTVAQNRAHVEVSTRQPGNGWLLKETDGAGAASLPSLGVELQLSEVYEKVELTLLP